MVLEWSLAPFQSSSKWSFFSHPEIYQLERRSLKSFIQMNATRGSHILEVENMKNDTLK